MADYVDIQEDYFVAGDFDLRKRYIRTRTGAAAQVAVCSGVTWTMGPGGTQNGHPYRTWRWSLSGYGTVQYTINTPAGLAAAPAPSPQRVTGCII